ncbi:Ms5788A family Cys-rich leader peptide [Micromonospora aurantiaca]
MGTHLTKRRAVDLCRVATCLCRPVIWRRGCLRPPERRPPGSTNLPRFPLLNARQRRRRTYP